LLPDENGNPCFLKVNRNNGNRKLNLVNFKGKWNNNYAFLLRKTLCSPPIYFGGVFLSRPFFQPPNILPISFRSSERVEYFSLETHLFSQAICKKNFTPSSLEMAVVNLIILVSGGKYLYE